ncbi:hypothetical protein BH09PSE4_BH09PSE4_00970 [soil metagenome]
MVPREIVGSEEEKDPAAGLIADRGGLFGRGGAGEEDGGGFGRRVGRADGDPALVLVGLVTVLDEVKPSLPT